MSIDFNSIENNNNDIKKDVKEKMKRAKKEHDRLSKLPEGTFLSDDEEEPAWVSKKEPTVSSISSKKEPTVSSISSKKEPTVSSLISKKEPTVSSLISKKEPTVGTCYWCNKKLRDSVTHYSICKEIYNPIRKLVEKGTPLSTAWKEVLTIEKNKWISKGNRTGREPTEENLDQWFSAWCFLNRAPTNLKR